MSIISLSSADDGTTIRRTYTMKNPWLFYFKYVMDIFI